MTEPVDIDALASAYIDDELDATERPAAESNPDVMAKVAEFRLVADLMRGPVAIDPSTRERSLAVALGHLQETATEVTPLRAQRPRRSWRSNPALVWGPIGLVAAGLLVVAVVTQGSNQDGGASSSATFAAEVSASAKAGSAADQASASQGPSATVAAGSATTAAGAATTSAASGTSAGVSELTTAAAATRLVDLGAVASAAELGSRLTGRSSAGTPNTVISNTVISNTVSAPATTAATATATTQATGSPPSTLAAPNAASPASCPGLGAAVAVATLEGIDVVVFEDARGGFAIVDRSCQQLSRLDAGGAVTP